MLSNDISLIAVLTFFTLIPFVIAGGTCFIKFSIVLVMIRNALGVQQIPSNLTLNGIALLLTAFVMAPVCQNILNYIESNNIDFNNRQSVVQFINSGLGGYKTYLVRYSDKNLISYFYKIQNKSINQDQEEQVSLDLKDDEEMVALPLTTLMPAYALSEIQSAFKIAFYLYVPFVVIDLVVSSILLALGMMMMSPVTISIPIKLILFVSMNGWTLLSKGLVSQYTGLMMQ
ncbi:TPA: EscR/YscR/HrcR family type III secretion system export apparatus protein [Escherichia coli]|nr:EscR/YscR/HrcR family type III secretion system export apparatus protein [Escherichia coli]HBA9522820.1 EscR/YscR/HrcR family type III secretion system export apparatus protein [Escherichia coli]HBA9550938.1 EscR/YscR/HrcR family type III secretion system export apparatus protein [Escherichia coli]HBA9560254.1 EscR/YscR/HrcR family type III secretion system export apparatus protein [Escherichia coli]